MGLGSGPYRQVSRDRADQFGGIILACLGLAVAAWSATRFDIGTLRRMGPGFYPLALGLTLAGLGAIVTLGAGPGGQRTRLALPELAAVVGAIAVFAFGVERFGLVGTTAASVLISSLATPRGGIAWRLALAACVTALCVMVFHLGLRMSLPLWP